MGSTEQEIERRFLVPIVPVAFHHHPRSTVRQFYTLVDPETKRTVRYRQLVTHTTTRYRRTVKEGAGLRRREVEADVSIYAYTAAKRKQVGRGIDKVRSHIPFGAYTIELDVFLGAHRGLAFAEVEFATEAEARSFTPPDWFGREVTDDPRYTNAQLALEGLPLGHLVVQRYQPPAGGRFPTAEPVSGLAAALLFCGRDRGIDRPHLVGIAGGSASGKTSFVTEHLVRALGDLATVLSMDDYFHGVTWMAQHPGLTWDDPEAIDLARFTADLAALRAGRSIEKPVYDFVTGEPIGTEVLEPAPFILVDGLYVLAEPMASALDVRVFVDSEAFGRLLRRLIRDQDRTGQPPHDILKYFAQVVHPKHERYVAATARNADLVLTNHFHPNLEAQRIALTRTQVKFRGTVPHSLRTRIGLEPLATVVQDDYYLTPPDRDLAATDELLRLRCESYDRWSVAYKGPRTAEPGIHRPVLAFPVDLETVEALRRWFGPHHRRVRKERHLYQADLGVIAFDDVSVETDGQFRPLGLFVEVRFHEASVTETIILRCAELLRIDPVQRLDRAYAELAVRSLV